MRRALTLLLCAAAVPALDATATPLPPATLTISNVAVMEGNSGITRAVFHVHLLRGEGVQGPVRVNWTTQDLTARAGSDYRATSGMHVFPATGTGELEIVVEVFGDRVPEGTQVFFVKLDEDSGAVVTPGHAHGLILDDEDGPVHAAKCDLDGEGRSNLLVSGDHTGAGLFPIEGGGPVLEDWGVDGTVVTPGPNGSSYPARAEGGWIPVAMDDFDASGTCDLFWERGDELALTLTPLNAPPHAPGAEDVLRIPRPGPGWDVVGSGPFNSDDQADLLWWNASTRTLQVWLWGAEPQVHTLSPANSDLGDPVAVLGSSLETSTGILWRHPLSGALVYWRMSGYELAEAIQIPFPPLSMIDLSWRVAATGDFDGDGYDDLVWQEPVGPPPGESGAGQALLASGADSGGRATIWFMKNTTEAYESLFNPERLELEDGRAGFIAGPR